MIGRLKRAIPERFKGPVLAALRPRPHEELAQWRGRKKVVVALAGFYQNLGDLALTYAQARFIKTVLPEYEILLFPSTHTYSGMKALKRVVGPEDIITTIGGGNMDDVYPSLENARRFVVRSFPHNRIISFPQTISFSETPVGRSALRRSARTYRVHRNLTIFAREPRSLHLMRSQLPGVQTRISPDIVLSLMDEGRECPRAGIMLALREDKELLLSSDDRSSIRRIVDAKTDDVLVRDTVDVAPEECQPSTYEQTLKDFWDLVAARRVVITDRLHGMIFCVITKTPVIVLPNSNHKVRETYETWLKDYDSVRFLDGFTEEALSQAIDELWDFPRECVSGPDLSSHYEDLREALREAVDVRAAAATDVPPRAEAAEGPAADHFAGPEAGGRH